MNILTKISVVVLVVFVLFTSAVFITYPRVTENWKQNYENMERQKQVADVTAANELVHAQTLQNDLARVMADLDKTKGEKDQKIVELQQELAKKDTMLAGMNNNYQGIQTQLADMQANVKAIEASRAKLEEAFKASKASLEEIQKEQIALQDQLRQKDAEIQRMDGQIRILRTDNAHLKELNDKYAAQLESKTVATAAPAGTTPATPAASVRISGQVTAVQGEALSVNVGSAKGVKEGMLLVVHRKDKLVGYLRVSDVEVEQCAGVIEDKQLDPQQGDGVYNEAR